LSVRVLGAALAALILSACATPKYAPPQQLPPPSPYPPAERPGPPQPAPERTLSLATLPGWRDDDHAAAFGAFLEGCGASRDPAMALVCRNARAMGPLGREDARRFFEANFRIEPSAPAGVLTAYFAPEYEARRRPDREFSAPVRPAPPPGAVGADRTRIETQPAPDALAWMRPEDLFFLQIQGSGVLTFEDGRRMKALYQANNGQPFVPIANTMRDRGLLARDNTSGEAIRAWLRDNRGPDAEAVMRLNPRYVFFRLAPDDGRQPAGAANIPLPTGRAIAVDPAFHTYGELHWIDAEAPMLRDAFPTYRRLVMALDTGGAIKGQVRADLYLGLGPAAGAEAGRVRHTLRMYRLVPRHP
jgi:membrane-bound lytic murein transglycosylase A